VSALRDGALSPGSGAHGVTGCFIGSREVPMAAARQTLLGVFSGRVRSSLGGEFWVEK